MVEARTYRPKTSVRRVALAAAVFFWSMAFLCVYFSLYSPLVNNAVGAAFFAFGFFVLLDSRIRKVVLSSDSVELHSFFTTKRILKEDIAGYRLFEGVTTQIGYRMPDKLVLEPKEGKGRRIEFALDMEMDAAFRDWLGGMVCFDDLEKRAFHEELYRPGFGRSAPERAAVVATARRRVLILDLVTLFLSLWAYFYPVPYAPVMITLLFLPWFLVYLASEKGDIYRLFTERNEGKPELGTAFLLSCLALFLRAPLDVHLQDTLDLLPFFLVTGAALFFAATMARAKKADPKARASWPNLIVLFFLSFAYAYGGALTANKLADTSAPREFKATVIRELGSETRKSFGCELEIAPAIAPKKTQREEASLSLCMEMQPGDPLCVYLYEGGLKAPWYELKACEK